jgi:protein-disulfide isomerase
MARRGGDIYTEVIHSAHAFRDFDTMTDNRRNLAGFHHAFATGAGIILIAVAMLLGACTTPAPAPVTVREPAPAETGQRNAQASGIASRDSAVSIVRMTPPTVVLAGSHRTGSSLATVAVVEFSDYQCPYCREFHDRIYPLLKKEYVETGKVQFVHKDLPLKSIHPQALPAALAASCAGLQKHFWPMHDALYANPGALSPELYLKLAHEFGLDASRFRACLADPAREQFVMRDTAEAQRLGINGTPSFVFGRIEGDELSVAHLSRGAPSYEAFVQIIDKLLEPGNAGAIPGTK